MLSTSAPMEYDLSAKNDLEVEFDAHVNKDYRRKKKKKTGYKPQPDANGDAEKKTAHSDLVNGISNNDEKGVKATHKQKRHRSKATSKRKRLKRQKVEYSDNVLENSNNSIVERNQRSDDYSILEETSASLDAEVFANQNLVSERLHGIPNGKKDTKEVLEETRFQKTVSTTDDVKDSRRVHFKLEPLQCIEYRESIDYKVCTSHDANTDDTKDTLSLNQLKTYSNLIAVGDGHVIFSKVRKKQELKSDRYEGRSKHTKNSKVMSEPSILINVADLQNEGAQETKESMESSPNTVDTISALDISYGQNGESTSSGFTPKEPWDLHIVGSPMQDGYHADIEDQNMDKTVSINGSSESAILPTIKNPDSSSSKSNVDYRELAIKLAVEYSRPKSTTRKRKYCDFVMVYDANDTDFFHCQDREIFEKQLKEEGIDIIRTEIGKYTYLELYCSFARLCEEAENVFLQMPLSGYSLKDEDSRSLSSCLSMLSGEHEPAYVTLPFCNSVLELFEGIDDHQTFFRPALRSMLIEHILQHIKMKSCEEVSEDGVKNVAALSSLVHSGAYKDAYILHERSQRDPLFPVDFEKMEQSRPPSPSKQKKKPYIDRRKELHYLWLSWYRFQPLTKVKDYFGEKIAFYFAWLGMLVTSLWIPTLLGLCVFFFGLVNAYNQNPRKYASFDVGAIKELSARALDNQITPYFALMICLWGTVFLEIWKRKSAELAYKWDVDDFEFQEPNRPQFYGVRNIKDPFSGTFEPFYPPLRKIFKSLGSMSVILFMILLVLGSVVSVITVKVISRVDWFIGNQGSFASSLMSSVLNSISILVLGKLYRFVAIALTSWENHRTQTQYEDALIMKLFGFQFVNSYSSLYYIAFFRERTSSGIFGKGPKYTDDCGRTNDCMSLLSLQVAVLMIMKPLPKFLSDFVLPKMKQIYRLLIAKCRSNSIRVDSGITNDSMDPDVEYEDYLDSERKKPPLVNFTLSEYTEKVIEYGYLMLFAAAFPLAPLIALVTNLIDLRVDARRLLWLNRRPIARRAQDIGMWYTILEFLNYIGVITNAFLVGLTSSFGRGYAQSAVQGASSNSTTVSQVTVSSYANLWIVITFQNIVLAVKFFVAYVIPDVPDHVFRAQKKEKQEVERLLAKAGFRKGPKKTIAPASTSSSGRRRGCDDWRKSTDSTYSGSRASTSSTSDSKPRTHVLNFEKTQNSSSA